MTSRQLWTPGAWLAIAAWLLWSVPSMVTPGMTVDNLAIAFAIGVLALIAAAVVGIVVHAALNFAKVTESRTVLIGVHATMGAAAGLTMVLLAAAVGLPETMPPFARIVVSAIVTAWFLDALLTLDTARHALALQREELIAEAATLVAASASQEALLAELRTSIVTAVDMELAPARAEISAQLALLDRTPTLQEWPTGASPLHDVAHDSVRPLVALLDAPAATQPPRIGPWGMVVAIARTQPFHPVPLSAIYILVTLPIVWQDYEAAVAVTGVAIGVALIFAITLTANAIMRRSGMHHDAVFFATIVVLQVPGIVVAVADGTIGQVSAVVNLAISWIVSFTVVLVTSGVGSWHQRQVSAQAAFREQLDEERVTTLARGRLGALVARDAARTLHGPVQARLAACAVAIDAAVQARDVEAYAAALLQAQEILHAPLTVDSQRLDERTVDEVLTGVVGLWRGLVEIEVIVDPRVAACAGATAYGVERVIEEGVTNAVRHGSATEIVIDIQPDGSNIAVVVTDNGTGPGDGAPGLGSTHLDEITDSQWSLKAALGGVGSSLTALVTRTPRG